MYRVVFFYYLIWCTRECSTGRTPFPGPSRSKRGEKKTSLDTINTTTTTTTITTTTTTTSTTTTCWHFSWIRTCAAHARQKYIACSSAFGQLCVCAARLCVCARARSLLDSFIAISKVKDRGGGGGRPLSVRSLLGGKKKKSALLLRTHATFPLRINILFFEHRYR